MRTRNFKSLRGWLEYLAAREERANGTEIYETLDKFFEPYRHFYYFKDFGTANEQWVNEMVHAPGDVKLGIARQVVDFHWRNRTKSERERIAVALANGDGNLSFFQSFSLLLKKTDGRWTYDYCTSSLSGPNYDWCKRNYLRSI